MPTHPEHTNHNLWERLDLLDIQLRLAREKLLIMLGKNSTEEIRGLRFPIFAFLCDTAYAAAKEWHGYKTEEDFPFYFWPGYDSIRFGPGEHPRVPLQVQIIQEEDKSENWNNWNVECGISPVYSSQRNGLPMSSALTKEIAELLRQRQLGIKHWLPNSTNHDGLSGLIPSNDAHAFRVLANPASIWFSILLTQPERSRNENSDFVPGSTHLWLTKFGPDKAIRGLNIEMPEDETDHGPTSSTFLKFPVKTFDGVGPALGLELDKDKRKLDEFPWPVRADDRVSNLDSQDPDLELRRELYSPWLKAVLQPVNSDEIVRSATSVVDLSPSRLHYLQSRIQRFTSFKRAFEKTFPNLVPLIVDWSAYRHWYSLALDQSFAPSRTDVTKVQRVSLGSAMFFSGKPLHQDFLSVLRTWLEQIYLLLRQFEAAKTSEEIGEKQQKTSFAHQTSSVVDSLVLSVARLPEAVREGIGGTILAKLHLLRATIHSYRSQAARVDAGEFPYPWKEESTLEVYRDIGIQLGLARAQDARKEEPQVRQAGLAALLPENQPGQPGFERYRALFAPIPCVSKGALTHLRHSSFAVLILLALKQAVYHTVRAKSCPNASSSEIQIRIEEDKGGTIFACTISNPAVAGDSILESKDVVDLRGFAKMLSNVPGNPFNYTVSGPEFHSSHERWLTTTQIREITSAQ